MGLRQAERERDRHRERETDTERDLAKSPSKSIHFINKLTNSGNGKQSVEERGEVWGVFSRSQGAAELRFHMWPDTATKPKGISGHESMKNESNHLVVYQLCLVAL